LTAAYCLGSAPDVILDPEHHHSAIGVGKANSHLDSFMQGFLGIDPPFEIENLGFKLVGSGLINLVQ
jgi:hypothetical protein